MNRPERDRPDPDTESMFDFLDEKAANVTRVRPKRVSGEKASRGGAAGRSLPIIRKPVPVSESGPLRPPSPHGPGDVDDFAFLSENDFREEAFDTSRPGAYSAEVEERPRGRLRPVLYLLAFALVVAGGIVTAWPRLQQSGVLEGFLGGDAIRTADAPAIGTSGGAATGTPPARVADERPAAPVVERAPAADVAAPRSLGERFRDEVGRVETLVADGRLDEAESAIAGLDRTVYGYGITEFSALEERIASSRSGTTTPADSGVDVARAEAAAAPSEPAVDTGGNTATEVGNADAVAASEIDAERAEIARAEAEAERLAARRLETERAADAERRAAAERTAEAERVQAERVQAERVQAERIQAERAEAERAAAAEAARRERVAAERDAREAEAAAAREAAPVVSADAAATTAAAAAAAAEARRLEADARATDLRIAEQRAAALAEERRIASLEASAPSARRAIDDDDLQIVYASLLELKNAFEDRDIGRVIALSDPPGGRVQQLLQVFANSATVETRIANVSARPADDTVTGTLRIEDVRRADGSAIRLPSELASIALTSTRDGDGWSTLSW